MAISHFHLRLLLPLASLFFLPALLATLVDFHHCPTDPRFENIFKNITWVSVPDYKPPYVAILGEYHTSDESEIIRGGIIEVGIYGKNFGEVLRYYDISEVTDSIIYPGSGFLLRFHDFPFSAAAKTYFVLLESFGVMGCIYFDKPTHVVYAAA